ncbi:uncharacterized protein BDV17DRAFT_56874 [Aspergillus undulatus]|uniref:uncharacterized protein n=1 Tax=Aspergillus undulatus TaxID=1810928 RepID=UPI003CCDF847
MSIFFFFTDNLDHRYQKYHGSQPSEHDPPDCEVNPFVCESTIAYARLKAKGLCKKGVVPEFYGVVRNIQPTKWAFLNMFINDILAPNAILIEFIPNLHQIDLSNFSKPRLAKLRRILDEIYEAGVVHCDVKPRNMMVSLAEQDGQDRVLWIDFGSAQELPAQGSRTPKQERRLGHKIELVDYFVDALAKDYEEGKLRFLLLRVVCVGSKRWLSCDYVSLWLIPIKHPVRGASDELRFL